MQFKCKTTVLATRNLSVLWRAVDTWVKAEREPGEGKKDERWRKEREWEAGQMVTDSELLTTQGPSSNVDTDVSEFTLSF